MKNMDYVVVRKDEQIRVLHDIECSCWRAGVTNNILQCAQKILSTR